MAETNLKIIAYGKPKDSDPSKEIGSFSVDFNPNTFIIRHGTDWRHFRTALDESLSLPADIADLPRPIIGFHGLLADWVDYELIKKTAEHFNNGSVVLIGKISVDLLVDECRSPSLSFHGAEKALQVADLEIHITSITL